MLDCIAEENGETVIIDWKAEECKQEDKPEIYPEYLMQAAAYCQYYRNKLENEKGLKKSD